MSEKLNNTDWTRMIQEAGQDYLSRRINSPVVKMVREDGYIRYGVLGPLIEREGNKQYVLGIEREISENGVHSCIMGHIPLEKLKKGEIEIMGGYKLKIEFDGLASDPQHKDRKWSYWS